MVYKFDPAKRARLESPERLALLPVERVLSFAGVGLGERVLDAGCGTGVFTAPLASAVGSGGRVIAVDILAEMVEVCRARIEALGLRNVTLFLSRESAIPCPFESIDLAFACQLLHELHAPEALLDEVRRILAPGGRLAVIEWAKKETGIGPPVDHRLSMDEAASLLESCGFTISAREEVTWANYGLLARPSIPR